MKAEWKSDYYSIKFLLYPRGELDRVKKNAITFCKKNLSLLSPSHRLCFLKANEKSIIIR